MVLTGFFARGAVAALDGVSSAEGNGGAWDGNWRQIGLQVVDCVATLGYSFVVTLLILTVMEPFRWLIRRSPRNTTVAVDRRVVDKGILLESWGGEGSGGRG